MKDVCPKRVRPVLDREEELTKMKETMLQYVSITPAERLSNGWIFPHFYTVGFPGTVVWQIRDVFLFAFIFGTIPKSLLLGLKLPIYSGWTVDPSGGSMLDGWAPPLRRSHTAAINSVTINYCWHEPQGKCVIRWKTCWEFIRTDRFGTVRVKSNFPRNRRIAFDKIHMLQSVLSVQPQSKPT